MYLTGVRSWVSMYIDVGVILYRRGYSAAASQGVVVSRGGAGGAARNVVNKSAEEKVASGSTDSVSWVPDPVTGYYRPANRAQEIDVAELRAMLLKKN